MPRPPSAADEKILQEARDRLERCQEWESTARPRSIEDVKFCEGDSDNQYQWDQGILNKRSSDPGGPRPCLTINKTRQHCLQIVNDARQNKAQIQVRATGDGATYDSAQAFEGVVRHIEYVSNALEAYDAATWHQVTGGIGYWRVVTDWADTRSFDQEIFIRRVKDPLTIFLDPDINEFDGSDARFGFVVKDMPRDQFDVEHPDWKDELSGDPLTDGTGWNDRDHVRIAEYYRKKGKSDRLIALVGNGTPAGDDGVPASSTMLKSAMSADAYASMKEAGLIERERDIVRDEVEWFKIVGGRIVERQAWAGKYIPLVRVVGEETIIDGVLDRKGHTRALKDPQRMYNYWSSSATEGVALQGKSPYIASARAIEGYETYWNNANRENYSVLLYNDVSDDGVPIEAPKRAQPPVMSSAHIEGMKQAQMELMMASGQYQSQFGENENAKSGVAIQTRQRQGDNATYHYIDHLAQAIKFTGRILIDLIPKIYDTERVIRILGEDGSQSEVTVDPTAPKPHMQLINGQPASPEQVKQAQSDENLKAKVQTIFNPSVGTYDVEADIGPAYATRRQEAFNALSQIIQQNQELAKVAGDLLFRAADFPFADEIAERLKRTIPANILGAGPPPEVAQMQQNMQQMQGEAAKQMQALQNIIKELTAKLSDAQTKLKDRGQDQLLDEYRAETDRMKAVGAIDPAAMEPVIRTLVSDALGTPIVPVMAAHAAANQAMQLPNDDPSAPADEDYAS